MYALILVALLGFLVRFWRGTGELPLALVAGSPYLMLAAPIALWIGLIRRRSAGAVAALAVAVACSVTQLPAYVAAAPPPHGKRLVVMTANLRLGRADPAAMVAAVRSQHVDLLMVEELTRTEYGRLRAAGVQDALPYSVAHPGYAAEGTGLWSRYPIRDLGQLDGLHFDSAVVAVTVPGVARAVRAVALHVAGPVPDTRLWHDDMSALPARLRALAGADPVLVGGDFNATVQSPWLRNVLAVGYSDATRQAGEGIVPTYPADRTLLPPVLAIDHVLTHGGAVATSARSVSIPGSDHRALVVGVSVPVA